MMLTALIRRHLLECFVQFAGGSGRGTFRSLTLFMQCHIPSKQFDENASRQTLHCSHELEIAEDLLQVRRSLLLAWRRMLSWSFCFQQAFGRFLP